jgi:hypothetical protein
MADKKDINCSALIAAESLKEETRRGRNRRTKSQKSSSDRHQHTGTI